jgi:hypothetical protein
VRHATRQGGRVTRLASTSLGHLAPAGQRAKPSLPPPFLPALPRAAGLQPSPGFVSQVEAQFKPDSKLVLVSARRNYWGGALPWNAQPRAHVIWHCRTWTPRVACLAQSDGGPIAGPPEGGICRARAVGRTVLPPYTAPPCLAAGSRRHNRRAPPAGAAPRRAACSRRRASPRRALAARRSSAARPRGLAKSYRPRSVRRFTHVPPRSAADAPLSAPQLRNFVGSWGAWTAEGLPVEK